MLVKDFLKELRKFRNDIGGETCVILACPPDKVSFIKDNKGGYGRTLISPPLFLLDIETNTRLHLMIDKNSVGKNYDRFSLDKIIDIIETCIYRNNENFSEMVLVNEYGEEVNPMLTNLGGSSTGLTINLCRERDQKGE